MINMRVIDAICEKIGNDEPLTAEEQSMLDAYDEAFAGEGFDG
jgi:hypothetical protein